MKGSLHGGPSKVSSPPASYPIAYGKFVMEKYIKVENKLERYLSADFPIFILYFLKRLTFDKEEKNFIPNIKRFSFLKLRKYL